jgi:hypothetical protein
MRHIGGKKGRHREGGRKYVRMKKCTSIGRKVGIKKEEAHKPI